MFEVPEYEKFIVGDIKIGGIPIYYGGPRHLNVSLTASASNIEYLQNQSIPINDVCAIKCESPMTLTRLIIHQKGQPNKYDIPKGYETAFKSSYKQGTWSPE